MSETGTGFGQDGLWMSFRCHNKMSTLLYRDKTKPTKVCIKHTQTHTHTHTHTTHTHTHWTRARVRQYLEEVGNSAITLEIWNTMSEKEREKET